LIPPLEVVVLIAIKKKNDTRKTEQRQQRMILSFRKTIKDTSEDTSDNTSSTQRSLFESFARQAEQGFSSEEVQRSEINV